MAFQWGLFQSVHVMCAFLTLSFNCDTRIIFCFLSYCEFYISHLIGFVSFVLDWYCSMKSKSAHYVLYTCDQSVSFTIIAVIFSYLFTFLNKCKKTRKKNMKWWGKGRWTPYSCKWHSSKHWHKGVLQPLHKAWVTFFPFCLYILHHQYFRPGVSICLCIVAQ